MGAPGLLSYLTTSQEVRQRQTKLIDKKWIRESYKLITFMNTHSDGLYGTLSTFQKTNTQFKIGVSYASCGPTSCQGGCRVSEREDVVSLSEVNLVHSYHTSSFINPNKANRIYKKRGLFTMIYSYTKRKEGTKFPWTKCQSINNEHEIYTKCTTCGNLVQCQIGQVEL